MKIKIPSFRKPSYGLAAIVLTAAFALPAFVASKAYAYTQLNDRYIMMSSSAPGAAAQTYEIGFETATTGVIQAVVVDFCSGSPIIGLSTCDKPTGMVVGSTIASMQGLTGVAGDWTGALSTTSNKTLTISNASGASVNAGTAVTLEVSGFTNPTAANTTFYARILTYATASTGYTNSGTIASAVDAGGVALSTASQVSVSGTVQETLTFCVSGPVDNAAPTTCSNITAPALELGEGDPKALGVSNESTSNAYSLLSTNAGGGATIRMKNSNSCGGMSRNNGTTCDIAPATAASPLDQGTAAFGVNVTSDSMSVPALYGTASNYGMEMGAQGVDSPYGSAVASSTGVLDSETTTYTFGAIAANTTPAGVYTANMVLIATGTY